MLLEFLSLADDVEIFFHAAGEDELYIGLRFVIDQEVQFAAVEPCFGSSFSTAMQSIERRLPSERIASTRLVSKSKRHLEKNIIYYLLCGTPSCAATGTPKGLAGRSGPRNASGLPCRHPSECCDPHPIDGCRPDNRFGAYRR